MRESLLGRDPDGTGAAALSRASGRAVGGGAGAELAGPRAGLVGEGVSRARRRLVARSRHYAGRHFLSDPGEERGREAGAAPLGHRPSPGGEGRGGPWAVGPRELPRRPSPLQRAAFGDVGSTLLSSVDPAVVCTCIHLPSWLQS